MKIRVLSGVNKINYITNYAYCSKLKKYGFYRNYQNLVSIKNSLHNYYNIY